MKKTRIELITSNWLKEIISLFVLRWQQQQQQKTMKNLLTSFEVIILILVLFQNWL